MSKRQMQKAAKCKHDEFYTPKEFVYNFVNWLYNQNNTYFKDKVIMCPCDSHNSPFVSVLMELHQKLKFKKLIATCYKDNNLFNKNITGKILVFDGVLKSSDLIGNGDFRSKEVLEIIKTADIIITNPPFSLKTEIIAQCLRKDFFFILPLTSCSNRKIFHYFKKEIHFLFHKVPYFYFEGHQKIGLSNCFWLTNTNFNYYKPWPTLSLNQNYDFIDHTSIININKISDIPANYNGLMAVPVSILLYDLKDYNIIAADHEFNHNITKCSAFTVHGKFLFKRIVIKRKNKEC